MLRVKLREIEGGLHLRQAIVENQLSTELSATQSCIQEVQVINIRELCPILRFLLQSTVDSHSSESWPKAHYSL